MCGGGGCLCKWADLGVGVARRYGQHRSQRAARSIDVYIFIEDPCTYRRRHIIAFHQPLTPTPPTVHTQYHYPAIAPIIQDVCREFQVRAIAIFVPSLTSLF